MCVLLGHDQGLVHCLSAAHIHTHTHTTRNGFFCSYCLRSCLVHTYANRHTYTNLPSRNKAPQHTTEKHENANNEFKQETCRREMSKKQNEKKKESQTHTRPHTHTPTHTHTHTHDLSTQASRQTRRREERRTPRQRLSMTEE